jgi:hypothetical protein
MIRCNLQRLDIIRFQIRRYDQLHGPAPGSQIRDPSRRQGQTGAGEIPCGTPIPYGGFQTGIQKIPHQIIPTGSIGQAKGKRGQ